MFRAKAHAKQAVQVDLCTTQYEEDKGIIPEGFRVLSNLKQSVLDVNSMLQGRKLPLIANIIQIAGDEAPADYIIYTNADIGLMPYFYDFVHEKIKEGHDALVINRRRLKSSYQSVDQLPEIYADMGLSHPGFDCFVFRKDLVDKMVLGDICVGISFIGVALAHNLFTLAENPLYVDDQHLTFHLGTQVLVPRKNVFYKHNRREFFEKVLPVLKPVMHLEKFPYALLPWPKRMVKWILNPSLFTRNYLELEGQSFLQKCKTRLDEIRWRILQKWAA